MQHSRPRWDYLVLTAASPRQAAAFESELALRTRLGLLPDVARTLVAPDPVEAHVGSGGATAAALSAVLDCERSEPIVRLTAGDAPQVDPLQALRVLILHAGGDARRLASYGPIGKLFLPLPGPGDGALPRTLFDATWPFWCGFPELQGSGQVVIGCGDVLILSPPNTISLAPSGVTGIGIRVPVETASQHGVYVLAPDGRLSQFLQKASLESLRRAGAVDAYNRAVVDSGILVFDSAAACQLLEACHATQEATRNRGCDLYREICSALCHEDFAACEASTRAAASPWSTPELRTLFDSLSGTAFSVQVPPDATFLHFGGARQLLESARRLVELQPAADRSSPSGTIVVNSRCECRRVSPKPAVPTPDDVPDHLQVRDNPAAWVEGCDIGAELRLEGENLLTGCNVREPLDVPAGTCLDVFPVRSADNDPRSVVRWYRIDDRFGARNLTDAVYAGLPLRDWLARLGAPPDEVWPSDVARDQRSIWNAKLFPSQPADAGVAQWSWMVDAGAIAGRDRDAWLSNPRYSLADVAREFDHQQYAGRRWRLYAVSCIRDWRSVFSRLSPFSAADLAHLLLHCERPAEAVASFLDVALAERARGADDEPFRTGRMLHSLGAALQDARGAGTGVPPGDEWGEVVQFCIDSVGTVSVETVEGQGDETRFASAATSLMRAGMERTRQVILSGGRPPDNGGRVTPSGPDSPAAGLQLPPLCADELAWGRAPVRLDLGGGWTDTPPYSLEYGGCVVNAAVDLNGQPPVHVFARVIARPVFQITSIDSGRTVEVATPAELLDFGPAASEFALVKAALTLCGNVCDTPQSWRRLLDALGGGLQMTTLAAVPQGSGLGTSSILGAVVLAVVNRCLGRRASPQELFHETLKLEQALTTGGGWQDQVGGIVGGVKQVSAGDGLTPTFRIDPLPDQLLNDPRALLYYTGITRYAKNVLQTVVARVLNRERRAMCVLRELGGIAPRVAAALNTGDMVQFGRLIADVWRLNVALAPGATNSDVDRVFNLVRPFVHGAKLLGAGGGGFLLMLCHSPEHADRVRQCLTADPPNPRARFVEFQVNHQGVDVGTF